MDPKRQQHGEGVKPEAFSLEGPGGEAPSGESGRVEGFVSPPESQSPTGSLGVMREVLEAENLAEALKRVRENKGSAGVDGMTVGELPAYLQTHWERIRQQLLEGSYKPMPVKRVEIPKPDGGVRKLGIPTVLDRLIQQALMQVLSRKWDPTFSEGSYGFRPGRSAHHAVERAQTFIAEGGGWVVDIDLEKFFDQVNHDRLMSRIMARESDKAVIKLIRAFLTAGVMENGLVSPTEEGTPQGGPLSPLLSNLVLDELDKELEARGHKFVRYADDCNIYVSSERAGQRVMEGISVFITKRLKLKVNASKSAVARPARRKFLGFSLGGGKDPKRRIAPKSLKRFKDKVRELTRQGKGQCFEQLSQKLCPYLRGWAGYFGFCQTPSVLKELDGWIRRRLRALSWRQWRRSKHRFDQLIKRGVGKDLAAQTVGSCRGPWRLSNSPALAMALPNALWDRLGIPHVAPKES